MIEAAYLNTGIGSTPAEVYEIAQARGDRYLLGAEGRRLEWVDRGADWHACRALVGGGHASWLGGNAAPGIRLTGKRLQP